jgi:hypothetical protein
MKACYSWYWVAVLISAAPVSLAGGEPTGRIDYALDYYPPSKALVMHGGWGAAGKWTPLSEMWKLDASGWQQMDSQGAPAFSHHSMVFDSSRQVLVICGQPEMMNSANEIWEYSNNAWSKTYSLPGTDFGDAELAYDTARERIVLYRGAFDGRVETWELENGAWLKKTPAQKPVATFDGALFAYDAAHGKCVLVAEDVKLGSTDTQTWLWDGVNWIQSHGNQPLDIVASGMAYDEARREIVLLSAQMNTWVFDGSAWTQKSPAHSPAYIQARFFTLKYDPVRQKCAFFSGEALESPGADLSYPIKTWEWDGQDWKEFSPGTVAPIVEPMLTVERPEAQTMRISWPADALGFVLESADAVDGSAAWTPVPNTPQSAPFSVTVSATNGIQYFRLRKP